MQFGVLQDFRNPLPWRRPYPELYQALLDQIVRAEELGYEHVWLSEHHFAADGYNPALLPTAAAIAARTSRIRIGTFILILPLHHPVRVAEDATCVDILSNGRFDLGVGQGYAATEFHALHIPRAERTTRLIEGVELIRRLWTEDRVTFAGKSFQVTDLTLSPKPVQQPHPPIWLGARAENAIRRAARLGYSLLTTVGPDPAPLYIQALQEYGRNPADFAIGQLRMVYVAESADQAWEDTQEHIHNSMQFYAPIMAEARDLPSDERLWPFERAQELRHSWFGQHAMIGTPDQVARKLERFCQERHCTHFIMATQLPGLDPRKGTRSLELFAREVMPQLRRT